MRKKMSKSDKIRRWMSKGLDASAIIAKGFSPGLVYSLTGKVNKARKSVAKEMYDKIIAPLAVDNVNHPPHYTMGGIETYDFIKAKQLSYELGNVVKYITRAAHKGKMLEDLEKAQWYLTAAIRNEEEKK